MSNSPTYNIPRHWRYIENLHIVFWLFKDLAWCMIWKPLGVLMIFPTFIISVVIAWRTRAIMSELCHNLAICVWILANSYWMISEFFGFDSKILFGVYTFKHFAVVPFVTGIMILAFYYLWWAPRNRQK
ncbi:MAG: hypothetical protein WAT19_11215 [Ferruginibacter sp.]